MEGKLYPQSFDIQSLLVGGKSSVLLDVKPWDDETDMKKLEEAVRSVEMPGLFWGACTVWLAPLYELAYYFFVDENDWACSS